MLVSLLFVSASTTPATSMRLAARAVRHSPPITMVAGTYSSDDWFGGSWREAQDATDDEDDGPRASSRWVRIAECDVLLPPPGELCSGIVHFVGGALVGTAPKAAYSAFLEDISDATGACVVCTACTGLTGLDHWQAASEVMLRWCAAESEIRSSLAARDGGLDATRLPVVGLGHSLGAKLLVLLHADPKMAQTVGARCANALVSYNSYSAQRSIPLLQQATGLADAARASGLASAAAPAVSSLGGLGETLGAGASAGLSALASTLAGGLATGSDESSDVARAVAGGLEDAARSLGALGRSVGTAGRTAAAAAAETPTKGERAAGDDEVADEFSPSPEETSALVSASYAIGRNLLVRFADDPIDQSSALARLLQARFTDAETGLGGRLDFQRLDGTHVTPNAPDWSAYLRGLDRGVVESVGAADAADALERAAAERAAASATVADFIQRELRRAATSTGGGGGAAA